MKPKVLIILQGGMIEAIASTVPLDIIVNDYDNDEENQIYDYTVDSIIKSGEAFKLLERKPGTVPLSSQEILLREHLKDVKF